MTMWFTENHTKDVCFAFKAKQLYSTESDFQQIDIYQTKDFGKVLVMDERIMLTEKDEKIYHEMIVHVPLAVHTDAEDVLIIGGGDGGALRELQRYPGIKSIDMVEIDSVVPEVAQHYLPEIAGDFEDSRFTLIIADGLKYVRTTKKKYDLIIVDSTDPFGPGESLFTREFYGNCYDILRADGLLVNQHESPYYKSDAREVKSTYEKTKMIFPIDKLFQAHIPTYPSGHWLFGFISKKYDPLEDLQDVRWSKLGLDTFYYNLALHRGSFALPNYVLALIGKK
ncbi:MAG: polyamine aminopropyltransferase [Saccharofermentanales bacterium]|jgi:spermidine synthase